VRAALRYVDVEDFDPAFATTIPLTVLAKTWGEGLVSFAEGTRILPELAERWEVDPTGTLFTFALRRGVLFHEGGILTSSEVKASFERYLSPALDVIWDIPYPEAAKLMADPVTRPYIDSAVQMHTSFLVMRCDRPPLSDVRVRRALNHAVDRHRLNERFFSGLTVLASSILPPHMLGHDPNLRPYRHDPERARALLAEAGHAEGLQLTTWLSPKDARDPLNPMSQLVADLRDVGVAVTIEVLTGEEMTARRRRGEFPSLRLLRWFADFPDPDNIFSSLFYSKTEDVIDVAYESADVDRLVEKGSRATDGKEREAIYRELNRLIQQDAPVVFLFHNRGFVVHSPRLRGVRSYLLPPPVRWIDLSFER
jgi:ABC-type transport system substrate-binding protein